MAVSKFLATVVLLLSIGVAFGQSGPNGGQSGPNGGVTGPNGDIVGPGTGVTGQNGGVTGPGGTVPTPPPPPPAVATGYAVSGPRSGLTGVSSAPFVVTAIGGAFTGTQTITITDSGGGGQLVNNYYQVNGPSGGKPNVSSVAFTVSLPLGVVFTGAQSITITDSGGGGSFSANNATYYMSPSGSDGNAGTAASPWASPNHAVNCGDTIIATAGTYSSANFGARGNWGVVSSCPSAGGLYFAKVQCAAAFSCIINDTTGSAVVIDKSNWAFIGWSTSSTAGNCMVTTPSSAANIHHIAFINNIANGCQQGGATIPYYANAAFGPDYVAFVGDIFYNSAQATSACTSGLSIYEPVNYDTAAGTHIFAAGIFTFANIDPAGCPGNTDGEGIIFDDWAHAQNTNTPFTGQGVIEQSLAVGNGNPGFLIFSNTSAPVYIRSSTAWGNFQSITQTGGGGELMYNASTSITSATGNLFQGIVTGRTGVYGCEVANGGVNDVVSGNYCVGASGQNTNIISSSGFSFGSNTTTSPFFASPATPSAPSCSGSITTTACMATVIANFSTSTGLGYQPPGACTTDALFPTWLTGMVPNGIITKPCGF